MSKAPGNKVFLNYIYPWLLYPKIKNKKNPSLPLFLCHTTPNKMATLLASTASSLHPFSKSSFCYFSLSPPKFSRCNFFTVNSPTQLLEFKFKCSSIEPVASFNSSSSIVSSKTEPMIPPYNVLITGSSKGW